MKNVAKTLSDQALKAYNALVSLFSRVNLDIKTKLCLFDSMISPILLYSADVWGIYDIKDIDKIHIKFCKYILGVRQQTPNLAVFGELGRYPMPVICKEKVLKYWLKIMKNPASPMYRTFDDQRNGNNDNCWAKHIKRLLDRLGYGDIWCNFNQEINYFPMLKQRLRDQYIQEWNASVQNVSKLDYFRQFKTSFCYEKYLDVISNSTIRKELTCLRLYSHNLEIEFGRFSGVHRNDRICKLCTCNVIESEYHFLLCCPKYAIARNKYLKNCSWPNIHKFVTLLSSRNKKTLWNIAKFVTDAFKIRKETLVGLNAS